MTDHTAALARTAEIRRDPSNYADPATASVCIEAGLFRDDGVLLDGAGDVLELVNGVEKIARLEKQADAPIDRSSGQAVNSEFTQSFDARVWAAAFVKIAAKYPDIPRDEGAMIGWFANALMRGHDEHARTATSPAAAVLGFAAWLTCRKEAVTFGATHDAAIEAELVKAFCDSQEYDSPPDGWEKLLKPYPTDV